MEEHDNIESIFQHIWKSICIGKKNRHSDFHTFSLATCNQNIVKNRTVVLRGYDEKKGIIIFHTNIFSEKIADIKKNDNVECLFYSKKNKIQIRFSGTALINHNDDICREKWNQMSDQSKLCYFQNINPGSTIKKPNDVEQNLQDNMSEAFVIISVYIKKTDWLYLSYSGHKRVTFFNNNVNTGIWVAP